jgi:hypothetical protein
MKIGRFINNDEKSFFNGIIEEVNTNPKLEIMITLFYYNT